MPLIFTSLSWPFLSRTYHFPVQARSRIDVNLLDGSQSACLIELHDDLWQGVDGLCEADAVVFTVVDRVVQLHEDVAQDVHLLQASLADIQF